MVLKSRKHVFWEALLITIVIFLGGLFLGMLIEAANTNEISNLYLKSEISLNDAASTAQLLDDTNLDCETIRDKNIQVANRIYEEAQRLELYEESGKLTDSMTLLHQKYDLLRTLLWMSNDKALKRCENFNLVVYLYEYNPENTEVKATQNVWSKILLDVREQSFNFMLLPIAANQNLTTTAILIRENNVTKLPALIVNNEQIIYEMESSDPVIKALR